MDSFVTIIYFLAVFATLAYAVFSIYLKKSLGLFIAAVFHIILGFISLPSIGLYVIGFAIIEVIIGILLIVKNIKGAE